MIHAPATTALDIPTLPPIDRDAPKVVETATFAMG